jgi:uncharacterized protein YecT (DUF1311 family)
MRLLVAAALSALAWAAAPALADEEYEACVSKGQTDADYRECGYGWVERADADLNAAWRELRRISSEETAKLLLDEQRAWNAYKEKACLFWASGEYGTIGSVLTYPPCFARVIEARTAELRTYLDDLQNQ